MSERAVFSKMAWQLTPLPRWPRRPLPIGQRGWVIVTCRTETGSVQIFLFFFSFLNIFIQKYRNNNRQMPGGDIQIVTQLTSYRNRLKRAHRSRVIMALAFVECVMVLIYCLTSFSKMQKSGFWLVYLHLWICHLAKRIIKLIT